MADGRITCDGCGRAFAPRGAETYCDPACGLPRRQTVAAVVAVDGAAAAPGDPRVNGGHAGAAMVRIFKFRLFGNRCRNLLW